MLSFEEIAEEAKTYANLTMEQIDGIDDGALHEQLSKRISVEEEVTASKKAFAGSATDLLKRIRSDILCLNREIRHRYEADKEAARAARAERKHDGEVIELLPEPDDFVVAG